MLPETGSIERDLLNEEAVIMAEKLLESKEISLVLYEVYSHFRSRFLTERGLNRLPPEEAPEAWKEALEDAQMLRDYVDRTWAAKILE